MKSMLKNFVDAYKVVLSIKESNPIQKKDRYKINSIIALSIILSAIFLVVGYLLQTLESLNYAFLSFNTIILATYIIYLISKNKYEQSLNKQTYNIFPVLIIEGSRFAAYWLLYNVFIYYVYLSYVGSIIIYLLVIIASILVNALLLLVSYKEDVKMMRNTLFKSIVLFLLHFSMVLFLNVKSIPLSYGISLAVTAILFFSFQASKKYKVKTMFFACSIMITTLFAFGLTKVFSIHNAFDLFSFDLYSSNIIKIDYKLPWDSKIERFNPWNVHMDENYIYYVEYITSQGYVIQSFLNVYDKSGNSIVRLDYPTKSAYVIRSNLGFYIQFRTIEEEEIEQCETCENEKVYWHIYRLSKDLEFELFIKAETDQPFNLIYDTDEKIIIFQDDNIGQYHKNTNALEWNHITVLEGFHFQTKKYYYFVEDGVAYSSIPRARIDENISRTLPFWTNQILAYDDGYAISHRGDISNGDYVLIEMGTQKITPLPNLDYRITNQFKIVDGYLICNRYLGPLTAYHLKEGYHMIGEFDRFYTTFDMSYRVRSFLLNDQIVIEMIDFTQGIRKTMRTSSNDISWVAPIIVSLFTFFVCKRKTRSWSK
jgi:hypothetical protein